MEPVVRPQSVEPYIRGAAWPAGAGAAYPRADPADHARLPIDTWATAILPVGVRLEISGDASAVDIDYVTATDDLGYRGAGAGTTFSAWTANELVDEQPAVLGTGCVRLALDPTTERTIVHLPEGMGPSITAVRATDGSIRPAAIQPRWVVYGDSIAEGWIASGPAGAWPARAGRRHGLDVVNLGYAGSARGEMTSAQQIAALPSPAVISITHGTNCWTRIPHSTAQMAANTAAFLRVVRAGHPGVPIVVASPIVRPDGETTPNELGATHAGIRQAMETAVREHMAGDDLVELIPGRDLVNGALLADRVHPGDDGHRVLAERLGAAVAAAVSRR